MISVEINNRHPSGDLDVRLERLQDAAMAVLEGEGVLAARLSLAIVDDATSHDLNRRFLEHDYPTDVLSFPLEEGPDLLEGEIVVSADQAARVGADYGWSAEAELMLYVIHGVLHLTGYDDHSEHDRRRMRQREQHYLKQLGLRSSA